MGLGAEMQEIRIREFKEFSPGSMFYYVKPIQTPSYHQSNKDSGKQTISWQLGMILRVFNQHDQVLSEGQDLYMCNGYMTTKINTHQGLKFPSI